MDVVELLRKEMKSFLIKFLDLKVVTFLRLLSFRLLIKGENMIKEKLGEDKKCWKREGRKVTRGQRTEDSKMAQLVKACLAGNVQS